MILRASILLFLLSIYPAAADERMMDPSHLIEVECAGDDGANTTGGHTIYDFWLSDSAHGQTRSVWDMGIQGGSSPDPDTRRKADECLQLLKSVDQPKSLPESATRILTVRCWDRTKLLVKRFSIDEAPYAVHQILTTMMFSDDELTHFGRIKFTPK